MFPFCKWSIMSRSSVTPMRNDRIHFIDITLDIIRRGWLRTVILQIDRLYPLKIDIKFDKMSLFSVPELFQMKNSNYGCLFYRRLKKMFIKLTLLTLHLYRLRFFPQLYTFLQTDLLTFHFFLCIYWHSIHLCHVKISFIVLLNIDPIHYEINKTILACPKQRNILAFRFAASLYIIHTSKWLDLLLAKYATVSITL